MESDSAARLASGTRDASAADRRPRKPAKGSVLPPSTHSETKALRKELPLLRAKPFRTVSASVGRARVSCCSRSATACEMRAGETVKRVLLDVLLGRPRAASTEGIQSTGQ